MFLERKFCGVFKKRNLKEIQKKRNVPNKSREAWLSAAISIIICITMIGLSLCTTIAAKHRLTQQGIADKIIRFHILANSDKEIDQKVKYEVRDVMMEWLQKEADSGREIDHTLLQEITEQTNVVLQKAKASYGAYTEIIDCYYPERSYGKYIFPAGRYKVLRIDLGDANGQNWWCVLYPQLYLKDCIKAVESECNEEVIPGERRGPNEDGYDLKNILTIEEYECLLKEPSRWKIAFRWF